MIRTETATWVQYHSPEWAALVEAGYVTVTVARDGRCTMIRQREHGQIVSGR